MYFVDYQSSDAVLTLTTTLAFATKEQVFPSLDKMKAQKKKYLNLLAILVVFERF